LCGFLEIGDDSSIIRSIQELLVKADDRRPGLDGAVEAATIRVLAIDDDPDMRLLIRTILHGLGFESYFASDGRPGVKMARRVMPNLILLDINMPGASGFDVLSAIRHEPGTSTSLIMVLSGCNSEADIRKGRSLKADDYVMKPFSVLNLTTRLRKLLTSPA
jgi:DNA-binding response OmpR family regulator